MSNDLDEFFEKVGSEKQPESAINKALRSYNMSDIPLDDDDEDKKKTSVGKLTQYARFGTGFAATSSTIKSLPSGCYKPRATQQGIFIDPMDIVTDNLIKFPDTKSDEIISEVESFWTLKDKFKEYGFMHKRGFLLWGPPGSGKSSLLAILIANMVKNGGLVLVAEHPGLLGEVLHQIRSVEPNRPIIVTWEDLDTVVYRYGESEVLNILDGEAQVDNIVFIATTNYPEKLDDRITNRPSRFDRIQKIDVPSAESRALYLSTKIGTTVAPDGTDLVKTTEGMSIAHLRELIVGVYCQGNKPADVLARLKKMKVKPNSEHSGNGIGFGID